MAPKLTVQTLAAEVRKQFVKATRTDGSVYWKRESNTEDWIHQLCMDAHGDMFLDDWRYAFIVEALDALEDCEDVDDVDLEADIYTHELTSWLGSRADRYGYCDEFMEETGSRYMGMTQLLAWGQYREKREVLDSVWSSLESRLEELTDEDEDSED